MKIWQPISNGGKFYIQFAGHESGPRGYILHEDSRGRRIQYRSIENARKAADQLNIQAILKTACPVERSPNETAANP